MATSQAIHEHSADHARLLNALSELDYVPSAFAQQTKYVKDLDEQLKEGEKRLEELAQKTKKEREEHEEMRQSTVRRFAHRLIGQSAKFAAKASKEEREFIEAAKEELLEKERQDGIKRTREEAKRTLDDLRPTLTRYDAIKAELDSLYSHVFDGPTPEFPEDDSLEYEVHAAQGVHDRLQMEMNAESHAADLLSQAKKLMTTCLKNADDALQASQWDSYAAGAIYGEMSAGSYATDTLRKAESLAQQVETLVREAHNVSKSVESISGLSAIEDSSTSDEYSDNPISKMLLKRRRIEDTHDNLQKASDKLKVQHRAACQRANVAVTKLETASERLSVARLALFNFRKETFQSITTKDRPPGYGSSSANLPDVDSAPVYSETNTTTVGQGESGSQLGAATATTDSQRTSELRWGDNNPYTAQLMRHTSIESPTS